jgi:peptidoglycan/LPS O-acetylase OafA/YrhL
LKGFLLPILAYSRAMSENNPEHKELPLWQLILLAIVGALIVAAASLFLFNRPIEKDSQPRDARRSFEVMD